MPTTQLKPTAAKLSTVGAQSRGGSVVTASVTKIVPAGRGGSRLGSASGKLKTYGSSTGHKIGVGVRPAVAAQVIRPTQGKSSSSVSVRPVRPGTVSAARVAQMRAAAVSAYKPRSSTVVSSKVAKSKAAKSKAAKELALANARNQRTLELAKTLGFPMPQNSKSKSAKSKPWSNKSSRGKSSKAKKKGDDVDSEEEGEQRKKIKWNMEPHLSIMRKAVEAALTGKSTTKIADEFNIPARTLRRYVANEKREADTKLLKTVDLGLSGFAKAQRQKAAERAAANSKATASLKLSGSANAKKASPGRMKPKPKPKSKSTARTTKKKQTFDAKQKKSLTTGPSAGKNKNVQNAKPASGSTMHHQMMMNYHHPPPALGLENGAGSGSGGRMRANSFEMLLKAYEFETMMNNAPGAATTSNSKSGAANTAGSTTSASAKKNNTAAKNKGSRTDSAGTGTYDRHLVSGSMILDPATSVDPSWPRRRTRTNSLDLLLNAAKLDTTSSRTTSDVDRQSSKAKSNSMKAPSSSISKTTRSGKTEKGAANRLSSVSIGGVEDLAVASGINGLVDVKDSPSLMRDRMSSFDADSYWARARSMSNLSMGGDAMVSSGSIGGPADLLRDRRASSMDIYDPFMSTGPASDIPAQRNRFESGSLDLLIQVCEDKNGPEGNRPRGNGSFSLGPLSFGSMGDLAAMSFVAAKDRKSSMADGSTWAPAAASMNMDYMESNRASTSPKGKKRKTDLQQSNAVIKKGRGTATKHSAANTGIKAVRSGGLKLKMGTRQPTKITAKKGKGSKVGKAGKAGKGSKRKNATTTGHALDIGGWGR